MNSYREGRQPGGQALPPRRRLGLLRRRLHAHDRRAAQDSRQVQRRQRLWLSRRGQRQEPVLWQGGHRLRARAPPEPRGQADYLRHRASRRWATTRTRSTSGSRGLPVPPSRSSAISRRTEICWRSSTPTWPGPTRSRYGEVVNVTKRMSIT